MLITMEKSSLDYSNVLEIKKNLTNSLIHLWYKNKHKPSKKYGHEGMFPFICTDWLIQMRGAEPGAIV